MTGVILTAAAAAAVLIFLWRWGMGNLDDLVPERLSPERRAKDARSLRRGARSCLALGILFAIFAVGLAVDTILAGA